MTVDIKAHGLADEQTITANLLSSFTKHQNPPKSDLQYCQRVELLLKNE